MITKPQDNQQLYGYLRELRNQLEPAFSSDTAISNHNGTTKSAGHCAAVSLIVGETLSCQYVSTIIQGASHWFNRISIQDIEFDIDITGDQFGFPVVNVAGAGLLYNETRIRFKHEVNKDTIMRAKLLAERARLDDTVIDGLTKMEKTCL